MASAQQPYNPIYQIADVHTDPMILERPGTIRWATGHPDGPRSLTWQVVGSKNKDDVYVAARGMMQGQKLSLHKSGIWRWAFTGAAAKKHLPDGADSLIIRYKETVPFAPGWRNGAIVRTPAVTFGPAFQEKRPSDGRRIRFFAPPDEPLNLQYHVLLGDPDAPTLSLGNFAYEVGRMTLRSGKRIWILATVYPMAESMQQTINVYPPIRS